MPQGETRFVQEELPFDTEPASSSPPIDFYTKKCVHDSEIDLKHHPSERIAAFYAAKRASTAKIAIPSGSEVLCLETLAFVSYVWSFDYITDINIASIFMGPIKKVLRYTVEKEINSLNDFTLDDALSLSCTNHMRNFHNKLKEALRAHYIDSPFESDDWCVSDFGLSDVRFNHSRKVRFLHFGNIEDEDGKLLTKQYIRHLIEHTDQSITTIRSELNAISILSRMLDCGIRDIDRSSFEALLADMRQRYKKHDVYDIMLTRMNSFLDYLEEFEIIETNPFYKYDKHLGGSYHYQETSLSPYVIDQIFEVLPMASPRNRMFFLLVYATGMRASEAAEVKRGAAYRIGNRYYLRYTSEKMHDKECTNEVGKAFYDAFLEYESQTFGKEGDWLFPNATNTGCLNSETFIIQLNEVFSSSVFDDDGRLYNFKPHAFRHTYSADLLDSGADFFTAQTMLHHDSPRMTAAYAEVMGKRLAKMHANHVASQGTGETEREFSEKVETEWLRANVNAQVLPNGICAKPVQLGKCDHAFACLTCPSFRTDASYLKTHKETFKAMCERADYFKREGYVPQLETMREQIKALEEIIAELEGESNATGGI